MIDGSNAYKEFDTTTGESCGGGLGIYTYIQQMSTGWGDTRVGIPKPGVFAVPNWATV